MRSLSQQVQDLEEAYDGLNDDHVVLTKEHETLLDALAEVHMEMQALSAELDWYHATFPEGSDAYACMRRME